jgi:hypothetical protein
LGLASHFQGDKVMSVRVRAVKMVRYGGKRYLPGQHFEATRAHAKVLSLMKKAVEVKEKEPAKKEPEKKEPARVERKDMTAKKVDAEVNQKNEGEVGKYERRDMTAKESSK